MVAKACIAFVSLKVAWFELVFLRRNVLKRISGELSNLFRIVLQLFFSRDSHNMATAGIDVAT